MSTDQQVRADIRSALSILADSLDFYVQTTHGSLGPHSIDDVGTAIVDCYDEPSEYNISELRQRIRNFLRGEQPGG